MSDLATQAPATDADLAPEGAAADAPAELQPPGTLAEALDAPALVAEIEAALVSEAPTGDAVAVTPVPLDELAATEAEPVPPADLRLLADIDVQVAVEFGRASLPLRDLLSLGRGQVLELDRHVEELVDVLVNGTLVARGEVVLVDGRYGVRIREIVSRAAPDGPTA